jgi:hypothetical protein
MKENKLPGGLFDDAPVVKDLNQIFNEKYKIKKAIVTAMNNQILFDHEEISKSKADFEEMKAFTIDYLKKQPGIMNAVYLNNLSGTTIPEQIKKAITNGYNARRSGDIYYILLSNYFDGTNTGTTHGSWNPYDSHIPCVFMGWKVKPGKTNKTHYMTDISATLAAMLHIQMPSGCVGEPITELTHQ